MTFTLKQKRAVTTIQVAAIVVIIVLAAVGAAWYYTSSTGPTSSKTELTIGAAISLTGGNAETAQYQVNSWKLWAKQVNDNGGIYVKQLGKKLQVTFKLYDDQSDAARSVTLYEKLITDDKVDLIIGPYSSTITFAVAPIAEKYKMFMLTPTAGSDQIFHQGWKYVLELWPLASSTAGPVLDFMRTRGDIRNIAVINVAELLARSFASGFATASTAAGYNVVLRQEYPKGVADLKPLLLQIKALTPDAVIAGTFFEDNVLLTRQMAEVGLNAKMFYTYIGFDQPEYVGALRNMTNGIMGQLTWLRSLPYAGVTDFYNAYQAAYNKRPIAEAATAYAACQIMQNAIEATGSIDSATLVNYIRSNQFSTIFGPVKYDANGINIYNTIYLGQWQNQQLQIIWPKNVTTATAVYPKPPW